MPERKPTPGTQFPSIQVDKLFIANDGKPAVMMGVTDTAVESANVAFTGTYITSCNATPWMRRGGSSWICSTTTPPISRPSRTRKGFTMTMITDHPNAADVKATLDNLITGVSGHSFEVLDNIYHADMQTYLLPGGETLMCNDKDGFMAHVKEAMGRMEDADPWALYHLVEADDKHGHILISRKNNVTGEKEHAR